MPLTWIRDEAEESLYQQSLVDSGKRFVVRETTSEVVYYLCGEKCGETKKIITEKNQKGKPYQPWSYEIEQWYNGKIQLSFDFMYPNSKHHLEVKPSTLNLVFPDKQLSLGI